MTMKSWFDLRAAVYGATPYLDPTPQHWLKSEESASYCRECAIQARGKEFDLGRPLDDSDWFNRGAWEDAFFEGISCYAPGCAGESDITEACDTCGRTLDYWLTDHGISEEIDHWANSEMSGDLSEVAYNIDRLFECKDEDRDAVRAIAQRFLKHAHRPAARSMGK
jgi:hypothetical protein